ncbi:MAG: glycosyltransferase [Ilumatobacteraceae bacterium]
MEPEPRTAPPVVAVVVVHEPGEWFEQVLDSLADQDYPNLRYLFLVTDGASGEIGVEARIKVRLPQAFVRSLDANPGFGPAANEVLRLVEGDNGSFLFCHDDVALAPDAVRGLVEEMFRSNAGAVGPKLVDWDDPVVLQAVGLGLDRFGEIDQVLEPGELDQEQQDGVRDVFVLPSACVLIRADLFRELGGFDPAIDFYGEDVELCWRIHLNGARVVVAPAARVRHRSELDDRRPDLRPRTLEARHRMRTVATLTGAGRLPGRSLELVLLTFVELVVGLFTGTFAQAASSLRALVGLIPRTPALIARRRVVKPLRRVPEREVQGLQERGSARLNAFLRSRETATYVGSDANVRRWRQSTTAPIIAWLAVLAGVIIGSRSFIAGGVPAVGEFLPLPESPRLLFDSFMSGWNPNGAGATSSNPTGWATLVGLSLFTLFRMGLLHTMFIVGLVVVGLAGLWRLVAVFPSTRARIAALLVYAASPLVSGAMSVGSLNVLVAYASTPWIIHSLRRAVGVETADPRAAESDLADGLVRLSRLELLRRTAAVVIVVALAAAFVPVMLPIALALAVLLAVGTLLAMGPWQTALGYLGVGVVAVAGAALLNLPWITTWTWETMVGPPPIGDQGLGLLSVASFEIGATDFAGLSLALYLPVVAALLLARAWRLTWAVRAGLIVVGFGALAVAGDRGALPFQAPEVGILLSPVAVGLAISAAAAVAAFDLDVRGGTFGWRQPLGIMASLAVVVALVPGVAAITDGDWKTPSTTLPDLLERSLPDPGVEGDYNVLLIGDARILPVPAVEYRDGISFALIGSAALDMRDRWTPPPSTADDDVIFALDQISSGSTLRAGSLLAPLGIRRIVIPEFDGVTSTTDDPLPIPSGLVSALENQLDIVATSAVPTLEVFENTVWIPRQAQLVGATADASASDGAEALLGADLSMATPVFTGTDQLTTAADAVESGSVTLAVPYDGNWKLSVDGADVEPRPAFGVTTGYDVSSSASAELSYSTSTSRPLTLVLVLIAWLLVLFAATRVSVPLARRRAPLVSDETLIDLDEIPEPALAGAGVSAGLDPGLELTGEIARIGGGSDAGTDLQFTDEELFELVEEPAAEATTEAEDRPDPEQSESEPETEAASGSDAEPSEAESAADPGTESDAESASEGGAEPESDADAEPESTLSDTETETST